MKIDPFPGEVKKKRLDKFFTTKTGKKGRQSIMCFVLDNVQLAWFTKWFPEVENSIICKMMGITMSTMHRLAREFNLTKSEKGLRAIKKRQARHIKRLCEKNGYYDSLRGRQVSDACKEGIRRRWQQVREGKIPHHYKLMEPRKYRQLCQKMSDSRRELIRKERMREIYGLKRETKIRLPLNKFTRRQVCHRSNAMKRGYFYMADCSPESGERYNIYYDQDTQRSEKFEQNLLKDGFKILNGENIV
jgi:hypothetical protein